MLFSRGKLDPWQSDMGALDLKKVAMLWGYGTENHWGSGPLEECRCFLVWALKEEDGNSWEEGHTA